MSAEAPARLVNGSLAALPAGVAIPRARPRNVGIVHLGLGAFHRAHQVEYTDDALAVAGEVEADRWGIASVSLKTPGTRDHLVPQDGLSTLVKKSRAGIQRRILGSLLEPLFLGDGRAALQARMAAPETAIVSLTITEKGYGHDPATGRLDPAHPEVAADLAGNPPQTAIGLIVEALDVRRRTHGRPLTVLCCDNLPHNGKLVRGLAIAHAAQRDEALARWIETVIGFPSTMVDRIVPATTRRDIEDNDAALGVHDAAVVVCEPFRQWVMEDAFVLGRPRWELAGAEIVTDVAPYEAMKLRLLNGSHSALAYLGSLAGYEFIYEVASDPTFATYMRGLMAEAVPTLALPGSVDLAAYRESLAERFANPALPHRTRQVAMDGSQKLPQRLLGTIRDNLSAGRPIDRLALAVAGWMRYVQGRDESGAAIDVADPMAQRFTAIAQAHASDPAAFAEALLRIEAIFGSDLVHDARFGRPVTRWLLQLHARGAAATVAHCNDSPEARSP